MTVNITGVTPGVGVDGTGSVVNVTVTTGGGGGVTVHNLLTGRDAEDAHPIGAITGLQDALDNGGASALADLTDVDVTSDPPAQDDVLAWDDTENKWTPATLDGGVALSDATPQDLGTAAAGVSDEASRADHVHDMPTAADVGAVAASIIDAKGDLIVGTAADTAARLPVGVNGRVLTAVLSVSGGVKWAAPSTPAYIGGAYHLLTGLPSDLAGSTAMVPGANTLVAQLVHIHEPIAVSGRWLYVQTAAPSAVFRPAIYAASTSTGMPTGEPLVTSPAVDASSTGYKLDTFTASAVIPAGFYWEITASSSNTAGFRGGHNLTGQPQVDMGHASGGTYSVRSFIASWAYSGAAMPDVSAFSWTARTAITELPPYLRWRIER